MMMMAALISMMAVLTQSVSSQLLTPALCATHEPTATWGAAKESMDNLDTLLVGVDNSFVRAVHGQLTFRGGPQVNPATNGGGTNPEGDYYVTMFPPEILPSDACDLNVPVQINPSPRDKTKICRRNPANWTETVSQSYLMGPADAMVLHLCTPPPSRYFSLDSYVSIRYEAGSPAPFYPGTNFGDTFNNCNAASLGFDSPAFVIATADAAAARKVTDAMTAQGIDPSSIYTHALDSSTLKLYYREESFDWSASYPDVLISILRVSLVDSASDRAAFQNQSWPISFYFAPDDADGEEPLAPILVSRSSTRSETYLADSLVALQESILDRFSSDGDYPDATLVGTQPLHYNLTGLYDDWGNILDVLKNNKTYQVATRDAVYGEPSYMECDSDVNPAQLLFSGENNGVVLFGVLHQSTLGAAYQECGVDVLSLSGSLKSSKWLVDADLAGSAQRYLEGTPYDEFSGELFAMDVMPAGMCPKNSSGESESWCVEFNITTSPGDLLLSAERVYQVADTCVGPDLLAILPSKALLFDLVGKTRDPCEYQFGAFACKPRSVMDSRYHLVYEQGCGDDCSECTQIIKVEGNPDLDDWATCHAEEDGETGPYSIRLECDEDDGSFLYTIWDGMTCEGECTEKSGPTSTGMCFSLQDSDDDTVQQCISTLVQPVQSCGSPPFICGDRYTTFFCGADHQVFMGMNCSESCGTCLAYFSSDEAPIINEYTTCFSPGDGTSQRMLCSEDESQFVLQVFDNEKCEGLCSTNFVNNDVGSQEPGICYFETLDNLSGGICFSTKPLYASACPPSSDSERRYAASIKSISETRGKSIGIAMAEKFARGLLLPLGAQKPK